MAKQSSAKIVKRAKAQLARSRQRERDTVNMAIGKGTSIITAAGTGAFEHLLPTTMLKIPTKLWGAAGLYLISMFTRGNVSKIADSAGDALTNIYAYKVAMQARMGKKQPFVAGDEEGEDEESSYVMEV